MRELIKDLEALKGDILLGYPTLPVTIGVRNTKAMIIAFAFLGVWPAIMIFQKTSFSGISYYLFSGGLLVFASLILLAKAKSKKDFSRLNQLYRLLIIAGILSLVLFVS